LGPTHISPRDLALGLRTGTIRPVDYTGAADDPDNFLRTFVDDGGARYKYDPMKVYTSSLNRHDHSRETRLKTSPEMWRQVELISGMVPQFGGPQGFVRDAILHSLHWWAARLEEFVDEGTEQSLQTMTMRMIANSAQDQRHERKQMLVDAETNITECVRDQEWEALEEACDVYEAIGSLYPDGPRGQMHVIVKVGRDALGRAREEQKKERVRVAKERAKARAAGVDLETGEIIDRD
jgi:hypothetical protein